MVVCDSQHQEGPQETHLDQRLASDLARYAALLRKTMQTDPELDLLNNKELLCLLCLRFGEFPWVARECLNQHLPSGATPSPNLDSAENWKQRGTRGQGGLWEDIRTSHLEARVGDCTEERRGINH